MCAICVDSKGIQVTNKQEHARGKMNSWKQTTERNTKRETSECKHTTHLDCVAVVLVACLDDLAALLCELWFGSELEETTSK
jgi:hypothetical protein